MSSWFERPPAWRLASLLVLLGGVLGSGIVYWSREQPASVLFLTVDTLRPDYMSMNGYGLPTTPALDRLLAEGFYFDQAAAPVPRTTPSLASLLTGAYPHTTGVRTLSGSLAEDVPTIAEVFQSWGYATAAVVTNQMLTTDRGLHRGFDVYDVSHDSRAASRTTDAVLRALEQLDPRRPLFAWVHYIDPHVPYHPDAEVAVQFDPDYDGPYRLNFGTMSVPGKPARFSAFPEDLSKREATHENRLPQRVNEHIRRLYAGNLRTFDVEIDRLVQVLREHTGDDLLVVFAADHGESLGEHELYFDHGDFVYNAGTRVPLAFVLPPSHPLAGAGHCRGWVSLVDVVPTLLELLGRAAPEAMAKRMEGRSLTACMRREEIEPAPVFAESGRAFFPELVKRRVRNDVAGRFRAVIHRDWKLVWTPFRTGPDAWELYDLAADPHETRNLYRPDHPRVSQLEAQLRKWMARAGESKPEAALSEQDREALKALGYL